MSILHQLSNSHLHEKLLTLSSEERKLTLEVLEHLREVERRRLYAERGHSSLFEYAVKELKYSESAAQRRIFAMRALKELLELESKVESGELKVTQLAQVQSFFRAEKSPESVTKEKVRVLTPLLTQLTFTADEALMEDLQAVRDRFAHRLPAGASLAEVIRFMAKATLDSAPEKKLTRKVSQTQESTGPEKNESTANSLPAPVVASHYIPVEVKRIVWKRDQGRCSLRILGPRKEKLPEFPA